MIESPPGIRKFVNRALEGLDGLYGIVGAQSRVNEIDLGALTLVHDVAREAEASQGFTCYAGVPVTTAGAGVQAFGSLNRAAFLATSQALGGMAPRGLDPSEVAVWILGVSAVESAASVGNFAVAAAGYTAGQVGFNAGVCIKRWQAEATILVSGGSVHLGEGGLTAGPGGFGAVDYGPQIYPIELPPHPNSEFLATCTDDAGGAVSFTAIFRCWICPLGTFPPGA